MKKKIALIGIGLAIIATLLIWESFREDGLAPASDESLVTGVDSKVTRAEVAKMVSLLAYSKEEIASLDRVIAYEDTTKDKWYDKYINGIYTMGLLPEAGEQEKECHPMGYLTFGQLEELVGQIAVREELGGKDEEGVMGKLSAKLEEIKEGKGGRDHVTRLKWLEIYQILSQEVFDSGLEEKTLFLLESWESNEDMEKWQVATDRGAYYGDGLNFILYENTSIQVLLKGDEIACITELKEESVLSNVWIIGQEDGSIHLFTNGYKKSYPLSGETDVDLSSKVGDVTLSQGMAVKVAIKPDVIVGRVLQTDDGYIEIEGHGKVKTAENFCIYRVYGDLEMDTVKAILVGYENAEFVLEGEEISAAVIKEPVAAENIRVLIRTNQFADVIHKKIKVTADSDFTIYYGKKKKKYKEGKEVSIAPSSALMKKGRLKIKTKGSDSKITLLSIERNGISPSYRGTMEVALEGDGMTIVNELPLEEYLYAVIPSEMPTAYGTEALKVQAICARSYAYKQLVANSCSSYGAHVDDSPSYQVYNNIPENKVSIKAVKETYGQVLKYDGEIITAYYFSTSCGHTANANEVWNSETEVPYLVGRLQAKKQKKGLDLSEEEAFHEFITGDSYDTYEKKMAWYRWSVTISAKKLKESIDKNLGARYKANPSLIQTLQEDGSYRSVPVDTVGKVEEIQVSGRKTGGIITEIIIKGSKNTVKVMTEYNIRMMLSPAGCSIVRQDKSKVESLSMLPSAFFVLEEKEKDGAFAGYKIMGGGYGHGVGMSQNGAKAMVDAGKTYDEILKHFYQGVEIGAIY